ncbi:MAG TPA: hemolysin family protein [Caldilineaceae bacterium]|nr:hemolysin family protein [Caldilineaceae bacterium]
MDLLLVIAVIILLIAINGFYVAAEFSTVSAQRSRLAQMADEGNRGAARILRIVEDAHYLDAYIAACQLGITLSSLILGFYGQARLALLIEPQLARLGGNAGVIAQSVSATFILLFLTILQVIFGELTPKNIGLQYPEKLAIGTSVLMEISLKLFRPLIWIFNGSGQLILKAMGTNQVAEHAHIHSPEEIMFMVEESSAGGVLDQEERRLLVNTLQLRNVTARKVMIPRNRIVAAAADTPCNELYQLLSASPYSRLPLYHETIDEIIGLVHLRDLMVLQYLGTDRGGTEDAATALPKAMQTAQQAGIVHNVEYVPDSLLIEDIMELMQQKHTNVAVVVDEYGGTAGMITFEDLIEEIIGEFHDEFDTETPALVLHENHRIHARGNVLIEDLNDLLGIYLPTEHVDTIGGLISSELGIIPQKGQEVTIGDITLCVEQMEQNSVTEVSFTITPTQEERLEAHLL